MALSDENKFVNIFSVSVIASIYPKQSTIFSPALSSFTVDKKIVSKVFLSLRTIEYSKTASDTKMKTKRIKKGAVPTSGTTPILYFRVKILAIDIILQEYLYLHF